MFLLKISALATTNTAGHFPKGFLKKISSYFSLTSVEMQSWTLVPGCFLESYSDSVVGIEMSVAVPCIIKPQFIHVMYWSDNSNQPAANRQSKG